MAVTNGQPRRGRIVSSAFVKCGTWWLVEATACRGQVCACLNACISAVAGLCICDVLLYGARPLHLPACRRGTRESDSALHAASCSSSRLMAPWPWRACAYVHVHVLRHVGILSHLLLQHAGLRARHTSY
eukprot:scaffold14159_cov115-Isochrysis_galbana.AAC.2